MKHQVDQTSKFIDSKDHKRTYSFAKRGTLLLLLFIAIIALWCTIYDRRNLSIPVSVDQDSGYVLAMIRLAQKGDLGLFGHIKTESLGAPFTGNLNDFPQNERAIMWAGGILARIIGLYQSANIMVIGLHIFASISFYFAARLWKVRGSIAWPLALVYSMSHQTVRGLPHLGIGYFGLLPLQLYCCWYIATTPKLTWKSHRFKLSLLVGLISGALSVYWIICFLQMYGLSVLYRLFKRKDSIARSSLPLLLTLAVASSLLGSFVVYQIENGRNPKAIIRSYRDTEIFSLKPLDLIIPKTHQAFGLFNKIYQRYKGGNAIILGESETVYIGLLSEFGLALILIKTIQRQLSAKSIPLSMLGILWVLTYASFGGINSLLSLVTNTYFIRSTNRYSAVISTISLLYFSVWFQNKTRRHRAIFTIPIIYGIASLALAEQCYPVYRATREGNLAQIMDSRVKADRDLVTCLEQYLPSRSMLFMMPVMDFPESGMVNKFGDYEHLRLFRHSTHLRYSFGSNKGRAEADWQHSVAALPAAKMTQVLESCGFSGILLNRRGYEDNAEKLLGELEAAGYSIDFRQGEAEEWVFIRLSPAANPQLPTLTP